MTTTLEERTRSLRAHNDRLAAAQGHARAPETTDLQLENARLRAALVEIRAILARVQP